ncbi:alpha/beta fold hydrolase [Streptomyces sp. NPDC048291]|uniref:alpha/beta fold hydrolase n=1 Tax=Streptomyces sp. NPDC048291 TaxID=3365530 RepID=UPI00371925DA
MFLNGSKATLSAVVPLLGRLAEHFEVVGFDQRGLGRSASAAGPYSMAELAACAVGLADHLGWQGFRVFGVSLGGMVAQELAVTWPSRGERLVLAATFAVGAGGPSFPLYILGELLANERAVRWVGLGGHEVCARVAR